MVREVGFSGRKMYRISGGASRNNYKNIFYRNNCVFQRELREFVSEYNRFYTQSIR